MINKDKKSFKSTLNITPKISMNKKWTNWRKKESNNRLLLLKNEMNKTLLFSLFKNNTKVIKDSQFNNMYKYFLQNKLYRLDINSSLSKQKNYCYYIGRSRSINRKLFMARHVFRKFLRFGMLPGFIKERC
jgi:ribosomal protein S14